MVKAEESGVQPVELKWTGDIRVRGVTEKQGDLEARKREHIRVRLGVAAKINPELQAEIRLATSRSNRSTNQAIGDTAEGASKRRFIGLDLAYAEWTAVSFLKISLGRIPQVHYRPGGSQVLLDEDMNLEGAAAVSEYVFMEDWKVFLNMGSILLRENYDTFYNEELSDNSLNWGQLGFQWQISPRWKFVFGGGFFNYTSLQGKNFADLSAGGTAQGNSDGGSGTFKVPYLARQYFAELFFKTSNTGTASLFAESINNSETVQYDSAWWLGAGFAEKKWDAQVAYGQIEADAVPGMFTNSDFAAGQTDSQGWMISGRWKASHGIALKLTEFINRYDGNDLNKQYLRTQLDLIANF